MPVPAFPVCLCSIQFPVPYAIRSRWYGHFWPSAACCSQGSARPVQTKTALTNTVGSLSSPSGREESAARFSEAVVSDLHSVRPAASQVRSWQRFFASLRSRLGEASALQLQQTVSISTPLMGLSLMTQVHSDTLMLVTIVMAIQAVLDLNATPAPPQPTEVSLCCGGCVS